MNQLQYYLIKGMVCGDVNLSFSSKIKDSFRPYLEVTFELCQNSKRIGLLFCPSDAVPIMKVYGIPLDLRPIIKAKNRIEKVAENKANKEFMKDLLASLTKTETYCNE